MTYLYSYSKWWYIYIQVYHDNKCLLFSISRCSVSPLLLLYNDHQCIHSSISQCSVSPFIYFTMFSVSTPLFFYDNQCLQPCVSRCSKSPLPFFLKTNIVSIPMFSVSIPLFHDVFTTTIVSIPLFHHVLHFTMYIVSTPLFHNVQCLHYSFFYDNQCLYSCVSLCPVSPYSCTWRIHMSKHSLVGWKTQNKQRNIFHGS